MLANNLVGRKMSNMRLWMFPAVVTVSMLLWPDYAYCVQAKDDFDSTNVDKTFAWFAKASLVYRGAYNAKNEFQIEDAKKAITDRLDKAKGKDVSWMLKVRIIEKNQISFEPINDGTPPRISHKVYLGLETVRGEPIPDWAKKLSSGDTIRIVGELNQYELSFVGAGTILYVRLTKPRLVP